METWTFPSFLVMPVTSEFSTAGCFRWLFTPSQIDWVPFFQVQSFPVERNCRTVKASRYFST